MKGGVHIELTELGESFEREWGFNTYIKTVLHGNKENC